MLIIFVMLIVLSLGLPTLYVIHDIRKPSELMLRIEHDLDRLITGDSVQPFSLSAYFDRIETVHIELLQEREQNPVSKVIELWWGLEGVRLLEDGTTEWVRKGGTQISPKKTATIDWVCEEQYRIRQIENANNAMLKRGTYILDKYREVDMRKISYKSLIHCYVELEEAIELFKKIRCFDELQESNDLLGDCLIIISDRESKAQLMNVYGINGIENANHKYSAELYNAATSYETAIQAQANQYFPQQFCQQSCNLESQINQSIAQQTQAIESDSAHCNFKLRNKNELKA